MLHEAHVPLQDLFDRLMCTVGVSGKCFFWGSTRMSNAVLTTRRCLTHVTSRLFFSFPPPGSWAAEVEAPNSVTRTTKVQSPSLLPWHGFMETELLPQNTRSSQKLPLKLSVLIVVIIMADILGAFHEFSYSLLPLHEQCWVPWSPKAQSKSRSTKKKRSSSHILWGFMVMLIKISWTPTWQLIRH